MRSYQAWTKQEDIILRQMYKAGTPINDIAEVMKRSPGAIRSRLRLAHNYSVKSFKEWLVQRIGAII